MIGRMSAVGQLGRTKYQDPYKQDWTRRAYYLSQDIKNKKD